MAEDLYSALSTPLKRRMLASSKIKSEWKKTDPKVILEEMEKVCLPPLNSVVERQQFRKMKQEENEDINGYESRIRAKATLCSYNKCKCSEDCYATKCGANREEDEILDLVLGSMKDKTLQKEIWRKGVEYDTLEKVLNVIRASEGVDHHQSTEEAGQAVSVQGQVPQL